MILEMFAVILIMCLLAAVGAAIGYGAYRLGLDRDNGRYPDRMDAVRGGKRGLIITSYDPERRFITFYADPMTSRAFRQYGQFRSDGYDDYTGDQHWMLAVSRYYAFYDVLNAMTQAAGSVSPHGLDESRPAIPATVTGQYRIIQESLR